MQPIIANPRASLWAGLVLAAAVLLFWLATAGADAMGLFSFLIRLLHVLAAMVWIGLVFFVNFVQLVALQSADGFDDIEVLACAGYPSLGEAMRDYLDRAAARGLATGSVRHAAIAIANPVEEDRVSMTNHHWSFSIEALRREQGLDTLLVVNDFAALAMA